MLKGTKIYSILGFKCPHCHDGDFFKTSAYNLKHFGEIYDECPTCNGSFKGEAGFYYGAMYVSYGLGVGLFVGLFVALNILFPFLDLLTQFIIIGVLIILLAPWTYAMSKIIWANMFMDFKR